jgi:hypothetical protein
VAGKALLESPICWSNTEQNGSKHHGVEAVLYLHEDETRHLSASISILSIPTQANVA